MAVIFDLDGTLLDTPAGIVDVATMTALELGLTAPPENVIRAMIGKPLIQMFSTFGGNPAAHDAAVLRFRQLFTEHVVSSSASLVFPGLRESLDALQSQERMAVATSKILRSANEILSAAGLQHYFEAVAGADCVTSPKPAPDMALLVAERLGVKPRHCVVIGDSVHDMGMAAAANMQAIGVLWGVDGPKDLLDSGATSICRSPGGLLESLDSLLYSKEF